MFNRLSRKETKNCLTCNNALTTIVSAFETTSAVVLRRKTNVIQKICEDDDEDVDNDDFGFRSAVKVVAVSLAAKSYPLAPINRLPDEILLYIFSYLPLLETARATYVCRRWYDLLKSSTVPWSGKPFDTTINDHSAELLEITCVLPQLKCLHLGRAEESWVSINWPTAAIFWEYESTDKPAVKFDTKNLMVPKDECPDSFRWVVKRTLETMYFGNDCDLHRYDSESVPRLEYCTPESFCVACTYRKHYFCPEGPCELELLAPSCDKEAYVSAVASSQRGIIPKLKGIKLGPLPSCASLKQLFNCYSW